MSTLEYIGWTLGYVKYFGSTLGYIRSVLACIVFVSIFVNIRSTLGYFGYFEVCCEYFIVYWEYFVSTLE